MRALLDTNIIIHREASRVINCDIGILFKWLDRGKYQKCVHPITISEINKNSNKETSETLAIKLESYETLKTIAPISEEVLAITSKIDKTSNDRSDTLLINEVFCGRVDFLISEDKKIHYKAQLLKISDKVFTINSFLEKVVSEHPDLINYKVLSVTKKHFGEINLKDSFFDSFREDYKGFEKWFTKKSDEIAYVTYNNGKLLSFLYLKVEAKDENYSDITPLFAPKERLKIGTFKVMSNGVRLGERSLKIAFDNALKNRVDEIYVTIFDRNDEQKRLIALLEEWGFLCHGKKYSSSGEELVYIRSFAPAFNPDSPNLTYPFVSRHANIFLLPIYPEYHTELLPDSILNNESPDDFVESEPHRNAIRKVYISRSIERDLKNGDVIIFYRTGGYYKSVVTTIGIIDEVIFDIADENDFILKCRKRSIFTDDILKKHWNHKQSLRPFIVNFLYVYSFPKRINLKRLIEVGVIQDVESAPRGFQRISVEQFNTLIKETNTDEGIIVD
jgi:predicted nucleic acid-binding protein